MSKAFIASVLQDSAELTGVAANRAASDLIDAIVKQLKASAGFTLPSFGTFRVVKRSRQIDRLTGGRPRRRHKAVPLAARQSPNLPSRRSERSDGQTLPRKPEGRDALVARRDDAAGGRIASIPQATKVRGFLSHIPTGPSARNVLINKNQ